MITKYEKELITEKEGVEEKVISLVDKEEDADYIHYCGHDTNPPTSCKRVKIK